MASNDRSTAVEKIRYAKSAFDRYLVTFQQPDHYLSVRDKDAGPRRRRDGDEAFIRDRRSENKANYVWSDAKHRWVTKDGKDVYPENMIWDVVSYVLCHTPSRSATKVFAEMSLDTSVCRGIDLDDVQRILNLWKQRGLDLDKNVKAVICGTTTQDAPSSDNTPSHIEEAGESQTPKGHDAHSSDNNAKGDSKDRSQDRHPKFSKTAAGGVRKYMVDRTNVISPAIATIYKRDQRRPPSYHQQPPPLQELPLVSAKNVQAGDDSGSLNTGKVKTRAPQPTTPGPNQSTVGNQGQRRSLIVTLRTGPISVPNPFRNPRRPLTPLASSTDAGSKKAKHV